jgi:aldehyde:ferredoxin oxidoreductase
MLQEFNGFWNRILRINLTNGHTEVVQMDPKLFRVYMGGRNLALHFLLTEVPPDTSPLSPENKLLFMTSVVTGAPISGQARHTASAISPLTGGLADSQCGGWWGPELKFAGWDGIIIEGRSPDQIYINLIDDQVELISAGQLHGKATAEVQSILKSLHGDKARIMQCGPAGENLVKYANLTADCRHFQEVAHCQPGRPWPDSNLVRPKYKSISGYHSSPRAGHLEGNCSCECWWNATHI